MDPQQNSGLNTSPPNTNAQIGKIPGPKKIITDAFIVYKMRFKVLISIAIISTILTITPSAVDWILRPSPLVSVLHMTTQPASVSITLIIVYLLIYVLQLWTSVALFTAIAFYRESINTSESFKKALKILHKFFFLNFFESLVFTGSIIICLIPTGIYLVISPLAQLAISPVFAGLLFFIPAAFVLALLIPRFFSAIYIVVYENIGGPTALLKSWKYAEGNSGRLTLNMVFISILFIGLAMINVGINYLFGNNGENFLSTLIYIPLTFFIAPLAGISFFLLYDNLRSARGPLTFQPKALHKLLLYLLALVPFVFFAFLLLFLFPKIPDLMRNYSKQDIPKGTLDNKSNFDSFYYPSPTQTISTFQIFTSADKTWSIQFDSTKYAFPPADALNNFVFGSYSTSCPFNFNVQIVENSISQSLEKYVEENPGYVGTPTQTLLTNGLPTIRSEKKYNLNEEIHREVYFTIDAKTRFFVLSYGRIINPIPTGVDTLSCTLEEQYIENSIFPTFRRL